MYIDLNLRFPSSVCSVICLSVPFSLISRTDKVGLIATEFSLQSCDCLCYLEQHIKSCKSYLVGKYIYYRFKNDHFYA